jgi:hypothetical protein
MQQHHFIQLLKEPSVDEGKRSEMFAVGTYWHVLTSTNSGAPKFSNLLNLELKHEARV